MTTLGYVLLAIVALLILWLVGMFNSLVRGRNRVQEAWADIDVQLKRRHDLIPNVVETVKGYAAHEKGVFENVTEARSKAIGAQTPEQKEEAENMLTNTLKTLFAVSENYPDLKANANFLDLQREVADTENKIMAARRFYNTNVRDQNIRIQSLPTSIFAGMFGFKDERLFKIDLPEEKEPVKVSFQ